MKNVFIKVEVQVLNDVTSELSEVKRLLKTYQITV